ncbi:MAG: methyltransferase domain-containing protein [Cyanobacteriota bacterium]
MDKNYYEEYFFLERNHWWFKIRLEIIQDLIKKYASKNSKLKILNVGTATGRTSEILAKFGEVTSVEYDQDCINFTQNKIKIDIVNASILDLPFNDNEFDLVCAFDVIEHVEDDIKAIKELNRVCKNNSLIFITVPTFMILWSEHDDVNHHYRRYLMKQVLSLFTQIEGAIVKKSYFNTFLFPPILIFRLLSKIIPKKLIRSGAGSDFTVIKNESIVNKILFFIFNLERKFLNIFSFPFGVSLFFIFRKN